jgi:hypothetical protein
MPLTQIVQFIKILLPDYDKKRVKKSLKAINRKPNYERFGQIIPTESLWQIYEKKIRPVTESPFLFNSFHWVTDIQKKDLLYKTNIKKILGYEEAEFTLERSIQVIHPGYQKFVTEYGVMAYRMLTESRYQKLSAISHYCIQYPIRHYNGHYLLVQMDASVVQIDSIGNPIANYNRFELLGNYLNVPIIIRPRVYFRTTVHNHLAEAAHEAEAELSERVKNSLLKTIGFSDIEKEILTLSLTHTIPEIAQKRDRSMDTIKSQNKGILEKARETFWVEFPSVKSVAEYLKNIEII